jgi:tRNA uracil 4-sulfurtransferase
VHFHSAPYTGPAIKQKIVELVSVLKQFQNKSTLYFVPFADVQIKIKEMAQEKYRTILYRRMMHRIADKIKESEGALGLITGDSIGQVSSQTVENMSSIMEAVKGPIFQPLIGMDKVEIIERARKIGTYDISIQDVADCCTLFTPKFPATKSSIESLKEIETNLELPEYIGALMPKIETILF